jgi:hypothetical protein
MGDREQFQSRSQLQQPSQLASWRIVVHEQNALSQYISPFTCDFLTQIYGTTLLKIVNHDYSLTISKNEAIIFPADGTVVNFFRGGEPGFFIF